MAYKVNGTSIIDNSSRTLNMGEVVNAIGAATGTATINLANGNFVTATLTGNCTFVFTGASAGASSFTLFLTNDSVSNRSITWPASVRWPNSIIPIRTTTANRTDIYTFFTLDGGANWYGSLTLYNYS